MEHTEAAYLTFDIIGTIIAFLAVIFSVTGIWNRWGL